MSPVLFFVLLASPPASALSPTPIDPPSLDGALAPNLSSSRDAILLSWLEPVPPDRFRLRLSELRGSKWTPPTTILESDRVFANWADFPSVTDSGGRLMAHFAEKSGPDPYAYFVELATLEKGATKWRRLGPAHDDRTATEHGFVSILPEAERAFRIFWLDGRQMAPELAIKGPMTLRTVRADGATTEKPAVLDDRVCDCCGTAAAMTDRGPIIVYRDRTEDEIRDIAIVRATSNGWTPPRVIHADGWKIPGCPVNGPAIDARGRFVAVAWFTAAQGSEVRLAFSDDSGATFGPPIRVDDGVTGEALGRVDVVLLREGAAVVSWLQGEADGRARVLLRRVGADRAAGPVVTAFTTSPARSSGFPRMTSRGSELVLSWTEVGPPQRVRAAVLPIDDIPRRGPSQPEARIPPTLAPTDFTAASLDGLPRSLGALRGRPVLLHLWATWCVPCRSEIPELERLHQRYEKEGLAIVGVSVDSRESLQSLRRFVETNGISYDVWHDPDERSLRTFGAPAVPASFLFDRGGELRWKRIGALKAQDPELLPALAGALKSK